MHVLADQVAWALGELGYKPAIPKLMEYITAEHPPRIRAMAIRALGKLEAGEAAKPMEQILRQYIGPTGDSSSGIPPHIAGSTVIALIQLSSEEPELNRFILIYRTYHELTEPGEVYEISDALCDFHNITDEWLLASKPGTNSAEALLSYCRSNTRLLKNHPSLINALKTKDTGNIKEIFSKKYPNLAQSDSDIINEGSVKALYVMLQRMNRWSDLHTLAAAITLFGHH